LGKDDRGVGEVSSNPERVDKKFQLTSPQAELVARWTVGLRVVQNQGIPDIGTETRYEATSLAGHVLRAKRNCK
jgi:protein-L-isoaspartate O-methyltransferase